MKKLSILILSLCLFLTGCTTKKEPQNLLDKIKLRDKIIVGIKDDSKPFSFIKNGEIEGFDADVAKYIANKIFLSDFKGHIEFVNLRPSERISALNTGKVDIVIATLSINERRKDIIDFSIPYYTAGQALMVPKGSRISSIEQLDNKAAAVVLGTTGEKTIRLLAPNALSIGCLTYKDAFRELQNGNVQAILADDSLLYGLLMENKGYKLLPSRYTEEFYAVGMRKGAENISLKKQIDAIIQEMQQTGMLRKIKSKWIPTNKLT